MNAFDVLTAVFVAGGAIWGWRRGGLTAVAGWVAIAAALFVALRIVDGVASGLGEPTTGSLLAGIVGLLVGAVVLGAWVGGAVHRRFHIQPGDVWARYDRPLGALLGTATTVALLWFVVPAMAVAVEQPARLVGESWMGGVIERLPDPPSGAATAVRVISGVEPREIGDVAADQIPEVAVLDLDADPTPLAAVVAIDATACSTRRNGSGFVEAETGLVVTNAHVVAGADAGAVAVRTADGVDRPARLVAFDADRDIAVLAVDGTAEVTDGVPLGGRPDEGAEVAVLGHPDGSAVRLAPARVVTRLDAATRDIYDTADVRRRALLVASRLSGGDSGAPVLDAAARVVGMVFAVVEADAEAALALQISEVETVLASVEPDVTVENGPCR